jgi:hypothetical protein
MTKGMRATRRLLLAGVSALALAAASPEVRAADLTRPPLKAPAIFSPQWTWWIEGGGFHTGGGSVYFGDPTEVGKPKWGWEGALGFDYQFDPVWHVSAQFRYGQAKKSGSFGRNGTVLVPGYYYSYFGGGGNYVVPYAVNGNGSYSHKETHWVADFAIGRDVGLGSGSAQVKAGIRIADIHAKTNGSATSNSTPTYCYYGCYGSAQHNFTFEQTSRFLGAGPRLGIEGSVPLGGAWTLDYLAGVAVLYGQRSLDVTTTGSAASFGINAMGVSDNGVVPNVDAQLGLSYMFTPNFKLTASYRFDGYWNALKTINSSGAVANEDRFFYGPMLRATIKY